MITDMDTPLGHNIGNSLEVMESMDVLKGHGPADLTEVCLQLAANMLVLADKGSPAECRAMAEAVIADGSAYAKCKEMFAAQAATPAFWTTTASSRSPPPAMSCWPKRTATSSPTTPRRSALPAFCWAQAVRRRATRWTSPPASPSTRSAVTTSTRARASPPSTARRISSTLPPPSTAAASSTAPKSPRKPRWSMPSSPRTAWSGTEIPESLRTAPGSVCSGAVFSPK